MIAWPASVTAALVVSLLWSVEVVWAKIQFTSQHGIKYRTDVRSDTFTLNFWTKRGGGGGGGIGKIRD